MRSLYLFISNIWWADPQLPQDAHGSQEETFPGWAFVTEMLGVWTALVFVQTS